MAYPTNPPEPDFEVYKIFELTITKFSIGEKIGGSVNFRVSKDWLESRGYSSEDIILLKHKRGWVEILSTTAGEDGSYVYYKAELNSFSLFAIAAKPKPKPQLTKTPVQPTPLPTQSQERISELGFNVILVAAIVVSAGIVVAYVFKKRR